MGTGDDEEREPSNNVYARSLRAAARRTKLRYRPARPGCLDACARRLSLFPIVALSVSIFPRRSPSLLLSPPLCFSCTYTHCHLHTCTVVFAHDLAALSLTFARARVPNSIFFTSLLSFSLFFSPYFSKTTKKSFFRFAIALILRDIRYSAKYLKKNYYYFEINFNDYFKNEQDMTIKYISDSLYYLNGISEITILSISYMHVLFSNYNLHSFSLHHSVTLNKSK